MPDGDSSILFGVMWELSRFEAGAVALHYALGASVMRLVAFGESVLRFGSLFGSELQPHLFYVLHDSRFPTSKVLGYLAEWNLSVMLTDELLF